MARNTLVINCDLRETRVALIEDGVIAELQIERAASRGTVGNIVLGKVTRVLPGMQAAFIDVGMERAAFLHVEDLIRPDDFEAYLTGDRADERSEGGDKRGRRGKSTMPQLALGGEELDDEFDDDDDDDDDDDGDEAASEQALAASASIDDDDDDDDDELEDDETDDELEDDETDDDVGQDEDDDDDSDDDENDDVSQDEDDDQDGEFEAEDDADGDEDDDDSGERDADGERDDDDIEEEDEEEEVRHSGNGASRRKRRRRRRRPQNEEPNKARVDSRRRSRSRSPRGRPRGKVPGRPSRSRPITEVVKEGDEVIVQISKEPIGTKGARVTSHVSLPGRYVVYLPTVEHIGISKRIGSARERARLREVIDGIKPPSGGLIVRTVAEGLTKKALKADIGYLIKLWAEVSRKREGGKAPSVLYSELDLVLKTARDLFTDEIEKIVIDDKDQYARLVRFVEMFIPERVRDIELYAGDEPIFDAYGIEDEIARALSRKVPLPSGGYLIIDQAEALTAIDVNTGRFVGKGSKDLEETALKTNLEAVAEIAYQLRFRNVGGLVVLDLIDMDVPSNREKVWRALEQFLAKDKAKTTINRISELGLIEMTRKRTRESLSRTMNEPCFYCDGTGQIQSRTTIAYEILRQIRRERESLPGYSVIVNAHPAIIDLMQGEERAAVKEAERRYMRRIELSARPEYHIEQFDLQGK